MSPTAFNPSQFTPSLWKGQSNLSREVLKHLYKLVNIRQTNNQLTFCAGIRGGGSSWTDPDCHRIKEEEEYVYYKERLLNFAMLSVKYVFLILQETNCRIMISKVVLKTDMSLGSEKCVSNPEF